MNVVILLLRNSLPTDVGTEAVGFTILFDLNLLLGVELHLKSRSASILGS